jgi:hypothetical protein
MTGLLVCGNRPMRNDDKGDYTNPARGRRVLAVAEASIGVGGGEAFGSGGRGKGGEGGKKRARKNPAITRGAW